MATPQPTRVKTAGSTRQAIADFYETERKNGEKIQRLNLGLSEDEEIPPYEYQEYPKAMHAIDGETALANDLREEQKLMHQGFYPTLEQALNAAAEGEDLNAETAPPKASLQRRSHTKKAS